MTMTMRVYRITSTGERQDISSEVTDGAALPVVDPGYPPCGCPDPRCQRALEALVWSAERQAS